jgi:hypothetical protein
MPTQESETICILATLKLQGTQLMYEVGTQLVYEVGT